jgi:hypothetical protein
MKTIPIELSYEQARYLLRSIDCHVKALGEEIKKDVLPKPSLLSIKDMMSQLNKVGDDLEWKVSCLEDYMKDKSQ